MGCRTILAACAVGLLGAGCATGERPYLAESVVGSAGQATGDPAIDAVLAKLATAPAAPLTVDYTVIRRLGSVTTPAKLDVQASTTVVTIGSIAFTYEADGSATTCRVDKATAEDCVGHIDQARISDTGTTAQFWGPDAAKRLRRDARSKVGPGVSRRDTVAGQAVECVDVPLGGGTATFCVFAAGVIAKIVEGDVFIDATAISER